MTEEEIIKRSKAPLTAAPLAERLRSCGLEGTPDDFGKVGDAFDQAYHIKVHQINDAQLRLFRQRLVVDFAVEWMEQHREIST